MVNDIQACRDIVPDSDQIANDSGCFRPVEEHVCPYDADVHNDPNSLCNCCEGCTRDCADDI